MHLVERTFEIGGIPVDLNWIKYFENEIKNRLSPDEVMLRFVITKSSKTWFVADALVLCGAKNSEIRFPRDGLGVKLRPFEDTSSFNVALIVPTGVGAVIGGHAGDAGPVVKLLSAVCDYVITHPNVVNASDINEIPGNALYVEGSVLSRLLLGTIGLQPVRGNRVLVVLDDHPDEIFTNAAVNSVNAARATYGLDCPGIVRVKKGIRLKAGYAKSGRAVGEISEIDLLLELLQRRRHEYDAIALSSVIEVPREYHVQYFQSLGTMVNPWGGVEAMLTHTISTLLDVPSAHSPMFEIREIANSDPGIVDPRVAAEAVSCTFLQCILKGLQRSPRIVNNPEHGQRGLMDVCNISCMVMPDKCIGIPTLAALMQGIPVIAVRENVSIMENDLARLPWKEGQLTIVENYWEAAGVIAALKSGIAPASVRRPISLVSTSILEDNVDVKILP
jgi:hypothetical protein